MPLVKAWRKGRFFDMVWDGDDGDDGGDWEADDEVDIEACRSVITRSRLYLSTCTYTSAN